MNSHEFAKMLLSLPDLPLVVVGSTGSQDGYTLDLTVTPPWESKVGDVRFQAYPEETGVEKVHKTIWRPM